MELIPKKHRPITFSAVKEENLNQDHEKTMLKEKTNGKSVVPKVKKEEKEKVGTFIDPETKAKINSMIERLSDGLYTCTECDYTSKIGGHMREHIEKHIPGLEYPCTYCNKVLTSSIGFRKHKRYHVKPNNSTNI